MKDSLNSFNNVKLGDLLKSCMYTGRPDGVRSTNQYAYYPRVTKCLLILQERRLKRQNTLGGLDQYTAPNSKYIGAECFPTKLR